MNRSSSSEKSESPFFRPTRVLHILLITSGAESSLWTDGTVDRMIQFVLKLKKNPVLVLGPEGDDVLLSSRLAEKCDLAFNPNFNGHVFSSLQAGLHATTGPVLAMTLQSFAAVSKSSNSIFATDLTSPNLEFWNTLEAETLDLSRSQKPNSAPAPDIHAPKLMPGVTFFELGSVFPVGVSSSGAIRLKELPAATEFTLNSEIRFSNAAKGQEVPKNTAQNAPANGNSLASNGSPQLSNQKIIQCPLVNPEFAPQAHSHSAAPSDRQSA